MPSSTVAVHSKAWAQQQKRPSCHTFCMLWALWAGTQLQNAKSEKVYNLLTSMPSRMDPHHGDIEQWATWQSDRHTTVRCTTVRRTTVRRTTVRHTTVRHTTVSQPITDGHFNVFFQWTARKYSFISWFLQIIMALGYCYYSPLIIIITCSISALLSQKCDNTFFYLTCMFNFCHNTTIQF